MLVCSSKQFMARSSSGLGHRPFTAKITGSNPVRATSLKFNAWVGEWLIPSVCKTDAGRLRWFKSSPAHQNPTPVAQWSELTAHNG